jgi:hypothetical protein
MKLPAIIDGQTSKRIRHASLHQQHIWWNTIQFEADHVDTPVVQVVQPVYRDSLFSVHNTRKN